MSRGNKARKPWLGSRHAASVIGLTTMAEYGLNIALLPLVYHLVTLPKGCAGDIAWQSLLYIIVFFLPFYGMSRLHGWTLHDLNGSGKPGATVYVMAICLAIGWNLIATFLGTGLSAGLAQLGWQETGSQYTAPTDAVAAVLQVIQVAIIPPLVEELCFRGFYLKTARRSMGIAPSIVLTSIVFWLAHDSITIFPLAVGFGILGGVLRIRYQSLLPSMCGHFVVNGSYLLINGLYLKLSYADYLQANLIFIAVELLCLVLGVGIAVNQGLFATARAYFRHTDSEKWKNSLRGVLTSIPFWMLLIAAMILTIRGMEAIA